MATVVVARFRRTLLLVAALILGAAGGVVAAPVAGAAASAGTSDLIVMGVEIANGFRLAGLEMDLLPTTGGHGVTQVWIVDLPTGQLKWRSDFSPEWQCRLAGWDEAGKTLYVVRSRAVPSGPTAPPGYTYEVYRVQAGPTGTWQSSALPGLSPAQTDVGASKPLVLGRRDLLLRWREHPDDPGTALLYDTTTGKAKALPGLEGYGLRTAGGGPYLLATKFAPKAATATDRQLVDVETGQWTAVPTPPSCYWLPSVSPDGQWAVWTNTEAGPQDKTSRLVICSLQGEGPKDIRVAGVGFLKEFWSDDSRFLLFWTQFDVWAIDPAAGRAVALNTSRDWIDSTTMAWVPGTHIVVAVPFEPRLGDPVAQHRVWRLDVDSPDRRWTPLWTIPEVAVQAPAQN